MLNLDLQALTNRNHHVASVYVAAVDKIIEKCRLAGRDVKKVKFGVPKIDGDNVVMDVRYG
jgi:hypothetical protein